MSRSFKNITEYLTEIGYTLSTDREEYISRWENDKRNFRFEYKCPDGHSTETSLAIYNNSKTQIKKGTRKELCSKCNGGRGVKHNSKFEDKKRFILEHTGHILLNISKDRKCEYRCGNCGEVSKSDTSNLTTKHNRKCIKCRYIEDRNILENVVKSFLESGYILLENNYKNNKEKMICKCANCECRYNISLSEIHRGRVCIRCKTKSTTSVNIYKTIKNCSTEYIKKFMKITCEKYNIPFEKLEEIYLDTFILNSTEKRIKVLKTEFSQENLKKFEEYKTNEKIKWKCIKNSSHIWETRLYNRLNQNTECPYCTGTKILYNDEKSLAVARPDLLREWDYSLNKDDPKNLSLQTSKKVWWKCSKNHSWQNCIRNRVNKKGIDCPYCSNRKILPGFNSLKVLYPKILKEWDYSLNKEIIDPDNILPNSKIKVWWKCIKGHSWNVNILLRVRDNTGCPYCKNRRILADYSNSLKYSRPDVMKEWDYNLNSDIIDPQKVSVGSNTSVYWKCEKGHSWKTSIRNRVNRKGTSCSECRRLELLDKRGSLADKYPDIVSEWDYNKNILTPNDIFSSTNKKFWWKCIKGHSWESTPNNRTGTNSRGCPVCKQSKGEKIISNYLDKTEIKYISQYKIRYDECERLFYDFYLPNHNIFIEFDGIQHFEIVPHFGGEEGFSVRYRNDIYKNSFALENGYLLLRISCHDLTDEIGRKGYTDIIHDFLKSEIREYDNPESGTIVYSENYPKNWFS